MITQNFNKLHTASAERLLGKLIDEHALQATVPKHATWPVKLRIDRYNQDALLKVSANFTQDRKMLAHYNMKPNKGLLITGATGVGKTHIMKLIRLFMMRHTDLNPYVYELEVAASLLANFEKDSDSAVKKFSFPRTRGGKLMDFCIDDILSERAGNSYGRGEVKYIADVIMERYPLFTDQSIYTHFTTNGRSLELLENYGNKVFPRLLEMCNIVVFPSEATDWRVFNHDLE